ERKTAMKNSIQTAKSTKPVSGSIRRSPWRRGFLLIPLALVLAFFGLSPAAPAGEPPPDGGYPGFNTAEGENALFNLDTRTGSSNTAIGNDALFSTTTGVGNTATGAFAIWAKTTGF